MRWPTIGTLIPARRFHVSPLNVRAEEKFGEAEEDKKLKANLRQGKIIAPFKARPEGQGYGVVVGRRRFLAKKENGTQEFMVGVDCLIENMTDEEAREASLVENLEVLRKNMNPVIRAKKVNEIVAHSSTGLRGTARRLGLSASTLSEWLKILELSPRMQEVIAKDLLTFSDGLKLARMKLGQAQQDELAELLETEGPSAFHKELARFITRKMKRGMPKGAYLIERVIWDKRNRKEMSHYEILRKVAEANKIKVHEYIKSFIIEHIDEIAAQVGSPKD